MTEEVQTADAGSLTGGDWVMIVISFFLTPLVAAILALYNFAKGRKPQAAMYLGVIALQVLVILMAVAGGR